MRTPAPTCSRRSERARRLRAAVGGLAGVLAGALVVASAAAANDAAADGWFALHGQATYVEQRTDGFHAPYQGPNSLTPRQSRETVDATLFLGARLWRGAELWMNPEADQGFGLDDTLGLAGFSSGEAYKVGRNQPYFRLQRAFLRQTLDLGGKRTPSQPSPNQFAQALPSDRLVVTLGKFAVTDIFDTNRYAHDPRADFLNWSIIDAGTFDYAADAWGYTVGAALEWYSGMWAWRSGVFDLSDVPNSKRLEPAGDEYQVDVELEHRHELHGFAGKVAVTAYESHGRMALLEDAIDHALATGDPVTPVPVRHDRKRDGISLGFEQELSRDLGVFGRLGYAGGNVEAYEFTDIDRTLSLGMSVAGAPWHRSADTFGVAYAINAASGERLRYLAAGGLGILVGDGQLTHPGHEDIVETFYQWGATSWLNLALDYQWVGNPAYNRDRGPVSIFAARVHAQF
ncbi:MAG TPA: carbohydrate porin [Steroidobacteraceae bacterium]|nr:carbohydrate porin [Steroidobacteraceae bacterium]